MEKLVNLYEVAKELFPGIPAEFQIFYVIIAFILFLAIIALILSPLIIFKGNK